MILSHTTSSSQSKTCYVLRKVFSGVLNQPDWPRDSAIAPASLNFCVKSGYPMAGTHFIRRLDYPLVLNPTTKSILDFTNVKELIQAFRDAIQGEHCFTL